MNEFQKYIVAGLLNTGTGYCVFWVGLQYMRLSPEAANAIGYAIALTVAFLLNRFFVFAKARLSTNTLIRFISSFAISFTLNQGTLFILLHFFSSPAEIAQVFSMATYTISFYLLNKYFAFAETPFFFRVK